MNEFEIHNQDDLDLYLDWLDGDAEEIQREKDVEEEWYVIDPNGGAV